MVQRELRAALWLMMLLLPVHVGAQQSVAAIEGAWYGVAQLTPDSGLPVSVHLEISRPRDSLRVMLTLPESRQIRLAIPSPYSDSSFATFRSGRLHVEFTPDIGLGFIGNLGIPRDDERIAFDGTLRGDSLVGAIRITTFRSPITLRRGLPAKAYREIPVSFTSAEDSLRLGGKLILPRRRGGRYPAVIFVTGSDPDTRDAWLREASALSERGIASLLYDKRGVGESGGASHDLAGWDDLAGDVEGGVALLRSRPEIDTARIGLIGQSQGTWILAKVAARLPAVKFLVNISGGGISAAEQETYRTGALMKREGFTVDAIARAQAFQRAKFAVARTGVGWESLDSTMKALRADSVRWFPGYGTGAAANRLGSLRLYGVLQFNYQPARDLRRIRVPTLVVMGEEDVVFPPSLVIEKMRQYLGEAGNSRVTTRMIPGVSHGMMEVQTHRGRKFRRAISREFLGALTDWVARTVSP